LFKVTCLLLFSMWECYCKCFTIGFRWWWDYCNFSGHYCLCYGRLQSECFHRFLHLYGLGTHLTRSLVSDAEDGTCGILDCSNCICLAKVVRGHLLTIIFATWIPLRLPLLPPPPPPPLHTPPHQNVAKKHKKISHSSS